MKKTLALVLAFALVFSTITVAFAETTTATISADAKACADLGMLVGAGNGVTAEYTATTPSRLQAATMALRLKGLEAEAKAFKATENFADVDLVNYADGKAILGYLKAHKELGWVGDGKNFAPNDKVTAQQYYKTLLESLGYKQNTADVVGDFTFEGTIAFAATKGLTKAATATNFTIADLATATVEGLKATVKGGTKTLATTLVDAKALDQAKVDAALGTTATTATAAKMKEVSAVAADKVKVVYTADVDKTAAETVASYKIVVKGSTTALEVKSAVAESATTVVLTTAKQTAGTAYTATVGDVSLNFTGLAAQTEAPKVDGNVTCTDNNTVVIKFTKMMDKESVENVANYKVDNNVVVKSIALSSSRKKVTLTTEGVANAKVYKVTLSNIKSSDLVNIAAVTKTFVGSTDVKAPTIKGNIIVSNNERIKVYFTDAHGVDKATAEDKANWAVTGGLTIEKVTAVDEDEDDYGYYEMVEIETSTMTAGSTYTLTANKLIDGSNAKNAITAALTKDFKGLSADKTAPSIKNLTVKTDDKIEVVFSETNRMDYTTLLDAANYTFETSSSLGSATVSKVEVVNQAKPDVEIGKTVLLTTSSLDKSKTYKLVIKNVADEFGNVVGSSCYRQFTGKDEVLTAPYVTKTEWKSLTSVKLYFADRVDEATAEDPANYSFNESLGYALKAEVNETDTNTTPVYKAYTVVTLTTPEQKKNTNYTVTINGVKDRIGNATSNAKAYFTSQVDEADTDRPTIVSAVALNKNEIRVTFDEKVKPIDGLLTNITMTTTTAAGVATGYAIAAIGNLVDDETTVVFKYATGFVTAEDGKEIKISAIANVSDKAGNQFVAPTAIADQTSFYGVTTTNEAPEVSTIEQTNTKTLRVTFTEPVKLITAAGPVLGETFALVKATKTTTDDTNFVGTVDPDGDDNNAGEQTVEFVAAANLALGDYLFDFTKYVADYMGTGVKDANDTTGTTTAKTTVTTYLEDKDNPTIDYVEAIHSQRVKVVYNENLATNGTYKITEDGTTTEVVINKIVPGSSSAPYNYVYVDLTGSLDAAKVYKIVPVTAATDIAGNPLKTGDVSFTFVGSSDIQKKYIKGVTVVNATTLTVEVSNKVGNTDTIIVAEKDVTGAKNIAESSANGTAAVTFAAVRALSADLAVSGDTTKITSSHRIELERALKSGVTYTVTIQGVALSGGEIATDALTYDFKGIATEGGLSINAASGVVTFSDNDAKKYVVEVVYNNTTYTVAPASNVGAFDMNVALPAGPVDLFTEGVIQTGFSYTVNVYRVLSEPTTWGAAYNGAKDGNVLYSKVFTRGTEQ